MSDKITHYRGDHKTLQLTVVDVNGSAVNLTDAEIRFTVKAKQTWLDSQAAIRRATANAGGADSQIKVTNGAGGIAEIYLVPADTDSLQGGNYFYDVQVKLAVSGRVHTVVKDIYELVVDITRTV